MILERGALLKNRYRIVEILGQGGMGSVYRALDENLGMEVAVKDNLFTTDEYARQFRREAQILANLRHPNLPRVTDHFVIDGQGQYLVMDYIEGEDLRQRMDRLGLLSDEEVITIGAAICDALTYLSALNPPVVHRDIKPGNVKITTDGQIFLVDFGLAKILQGSEATTTGARAMTPGYSPPEQYGTARTDARSDIFSLGATLYAALTGGIPEDSLSRAMDQAELTPIRKRNPRVGRRLASVIEKSLSVRPDDRYRTPEEFKQALEGARSITRRLLNDYWVQPPPPPNNNDRPVSESFPIPLPPDVEKEKQPADGELVQQPFTSESMWELDDDALQIPAYPPISRPPTRPPSKPLKRRPQWSRLGILGMGLALLLVSVIVYSVTSGGQGQGWAWLGLASPTPTVTFSKPTPTNLSQVETDVPIVIVSASPEPTLTPTFISPTETPTLTPTLIPTPLGGGRGQVAFASDSTGTFQIYVINIDGTGLTQITDVFGGACQPSWSPDGLQIVFISPCEANHESYFNSGLFVVNVDGTGLKPLTNVPGGDYDPVWSPDGTQIAFTSLRNSGRPQIYLYTLKDSSFKLLSEKYDRDMQPTWSPDGKQILFVTSRRGPYQIWVMDADGKNQRQVTHNLEDVYVHPSWSADGKFILFTTMPSFGQIPRMVIVPFNGEEYTEYRITQNPLPMREGRYSPDGSWIAFEGWPAGRNHDIYLVAANGGGLQQLTTGERSEIDPTWNPAIH